MSADTRTRNQYFDHSTIEKFVFGYANEVSQALKNLDFRAIESLVRLLDEARKQHRTVWVAGNGGSLAIAEHLCCDWTKGIQHSDKPFLKVQSLCSSGPLTTAISNDLSYADVFSEQVKMFCEKGDVLILISSSGNSANVCKAADAAHSRGLKTVTFTGFTGGKLKEMSDLNIHVSVSNYGVVEDVHQMIMHIVAQFSYLQDRG